VGRRIGAPFDFDCNSNNSRYLYVQIRLEQGPVRAKVAAWSVALAMSAAACLAAQTIEVDQKGQKFSAKTLTIDPGDTVAFVNHDDVTHNINISSGAGNVVDKGLQDPGEIIVQKFDKTGVFLVHCMIHQKMRLSVAVR